MNKPYPLRTIRSFVRRDGRMTAGQSKAWAALWPKYGLDLPKEPVDLSKLFPTASAVVLEIGFGDGDSLWQMAKTNPDTAYVGIEVYRAGVGHLLAAVQAHALNNVKIFCEDAMQVLTQGIADNSLDKIQLFFPDPWPKKRHHKRRIVQPAFVELLAKKLKVGGILHMATDWAHYAEQMLAVMESSTVFNNTAGAGQYAPSPALGRPETKFERRGQRLGHGVWDLVYEKNAD